jgi:hypothetical protein
VQKTRKRKFLNFRMVSGKIFVLKEHKSSWINIYFGYKRAKEKYRCAGVIGVIKFMGRINQRKCKEDREMLISLIAPCAFIRKIPCTFFLSTFRKESTENCIKIRMIYLSSSETILPHPAQKENWKFLENP